MSKIHAVVDTNGLQDEANVRRPHGDGSKARASKSRVEYMFSCLVAADIVSDSPIELGALPGISR